MKGKRLSATVLALLVASLAGCTRWYSVNSSQVVSLGRHEAIEVDRGRKVSMDELSNVRVSAAAPHGFVRRDEVVSAFEGEGHPKATSGAPLEMRYDGGELRISGRRFTIIADASQVAEVEVLAHSPAEGAGMVAGGVTLLLSGLAGGSALAYLASIARGPFLCLWDCGGRDHELPVLAGIASGLAFAAGLGGGIPLIVLGAKRVEPTTQVSIRPDGLSFQAAF